MSPSAITFDGQSLNLAPFGGLPFTTRAMGTAPMAAIGWRVPAIQSTTYDQRAVGASSRVDQFVRESRHPILVDTAGTAEIDAGLTAAQTLQEMKDYIGARRAAGFVYVVGLTVPAATLFDAAKTTQRLAYNALLTSGSAAGFYDAVVDIASIPELADPTNTTYFSDGIHFTAVAAQLVADLVAPALAAAVVAVAA